jgi:crossover junction endodeoxyribonuclease RuvC
MIFAGIDPGKDGAVAAVDASGIVMLCDAPTLNVEGSRRRRYDERRMAEALRACGVGVLVAIERQQAMPGQGVSSTFSTGEGFGLWKGICAGLGLIYVVVSPQVWQREMRGAAKGKAASVRVARALYPLAELETPRGRVIDGRADALLIAEWARRIYTSPTLRPTSDHEK